MMTDKELNQQLQTVMSLLADIKEELQRRQHKPLVTNMKLAKAPSEKNDPIEFYINCCTFKEGNEITAAVLFCTYRKWCLDNNSLTRGRKPFFEAIAQLGSTDGIVGVMRNKSYTFKNLDFKVK